MSTDERARIQYWCAAFNALSREMKWKMEGNAFFAPKQIALFGKDPAQISGIRIVSAEPMDQKRISHNGGPSVLDWYLSAYLEPAIHLISPSGWEMLATTLLRGWSISASRQEVTPDLQ